MAVYRIFGEHLVSETEFAQKGTEITRMAAAPPDAAHPSITLANDAVLSMQTIKPAAGPDLIQFPPVAFGQPMTVDIRSAYTGAVGSKSFFDGTGDIAMVSGVKNWSSFNASARALNFVQKKLGRHGMLKGPNAIEDGTRIVAYEKAVATSQIITTYEIVAAPPDDGLLAKLGGAFSAAAGIPLFMPYAGALLAAGQLVPVVGKLIDALSGQTQRWSESADLTFDLPGFAPVSADFRLVAHAGSPLEQMRYKPNVGVVDANDALYAGDEPYVVIAVYGGARPELDNFAPGVVVADMARRFYPSSTGVGAAFDDVLAMARIASDWKFRQQADKLAEQIGALPKGDANIDKLTRQRTAVVANIQNTLLRPNP